MTRPLIVLVAHGLDVLTFGIAVSVFGLWGASLYGYESNGIAGWLVSLGGFGLLLLVKSAGATLAAGIVQHRPKYLLLAAGAGIIGATVNLFAVVVRMS
jgi:hypothetical protein